MSKLFLILLIALFISACNHKMQAPPVSIFPEKDGKYDSEFPIRPTSPYLEKIIHSVKMVSMLTFYKAYEFALKDSVTEADIKAGTFEKKALNEYIYEKPAAGTITAIYQSGKKILFLTCNHIVTKEDTVLTYYATKQSEKKPSKYIYAFSKKIRQITNLISIPRSSKPKIIATDRENDLALVMVTLLEQPKFPFPVFSYPFGKASQLNWGTFVYLIGYPKGKLLLTSSVVSAPNRDTKHNFLINAPLTRGISGGIILALRDGPPHFELVGMTNALNAHIQYYIKPEPLGKDIFVDTDHPYEGKIYIGKRIVRGSDIIFSISAETIVKFLKKNLDLLRKEGFRFPNQFPGVSS